MKSKSFTEALEKRGIDEKIKFISRKTRRVFMGIITTLQKNLNSELIPHESQNSNTNQNFVNSCNVVIPDTKTDTVTGQKLYANEEQKRLWEDPESTIY
jgi:hypothetical protein